MVQPSPTASDSGDVTPDDGPRVGLASYDSRDPEATFRPIEPFRPRPEPRRPGVGTWSLRALAIWAVNLAALAAAGLLLTVVGASDPFAYVAWAAIFGLVNASLRPAASVAGRLLERRLLATVGPAVVLLGIDVALVWLMTAFARPFNSPDVADIAEVGAAMWLANLPLTLLLLRSGKPAAS
jgi:hypothetical protein